MLAAPPRLRVWQQFAIVFAMSVLLALLLVVNATAAQAATLALVCCLLAVRTAGFIPGALLAIALLQPLLLRIAPSLDGHWLWLKRADELLIAVVLPFALANLVFREKGDHLKPLFAVLGAILLLGFAGSLRTAAPLHVAGLDAFLLLKGFSCFLIFTAFPLPSSAIPRILRIVTYFAVVAAAFGFIELLLPHLIRDHLPLMSNSGTRGGHVVLVSFFENEGQAGWFFAFMATGALAFYLTNRNRALLLLMILFSAASVLTLRRKPLFGLALVLLLALLMAREHRQRIRVLLVLLLIIVSVVAFLGDILQPVLVAGYFEYVLPDDSLRVARNAMYIASAQIARDHFPLGSGFGLFGGFASQLYYSPLYFEYGLSNVWGLSPRHGRFIMDAFWPHVLGELGFLGVLLLVAAIGTVWWPLVRVARSGIDLTTKALAFTAILTLTEALAESVASVVFEGTTSAILLFGLAAVARQRAIEQP